MEYSATYISLPDRSAHITEEISLNKAYQEPLSFVTPSQRRRKPNKAHKLDRGTGAHKRARKAPRAHPDASNGPLSPTHSAHSQTISPHNLPIRLDEELTSVPHTWTPASNQSIPDEPNSAFYDAPLNDGIWDTPKADHSEECYELFFDAIINGTLPFYQLSRKTYVAMGWNHEKGELTKFWYHIHASKVEEELIAVCLCPESKRTANCFHTRFIRDHGPIFFPDVPDMPLNHQSPTIIQRYPWGSSGDEFINFVSVPPPIDPTIKNTTIVEYIGKDDGSGCWKCAQDSAQSCPHIAMAKRTLNHKRSAGDYSVKLLPHIEARKVQRLSNGVNLSESAISYIPVPPPTWARVPSDLPVEGPTYAESYSGVTFKLSHSSSCNCQIPRMMFNSNTPVVTRKCTVYGLLKSWEATIEVQLCPACKVNRIGPDCGEFGLFNFNNNILLSHEVLNDYISTFTTSETPFTAWVTVISRRYYSTRPAGQRFLDQKKFRDVWFSYARLMDFGNSDMICPECGPAPSTVIWDGVSISFNRKMALSTLEPPTTITSKSPTYQDTVRLKDPQFIPDRALRKLLREAISGPPLAEGLTKTNTESLPSDSDSDEENSSTLTRKEALEKQKAALKRRFHLIPQLVNDLMNVDQSLGNFFECHFGVEAVLNHRVPLSQYKELLLQIAAEENAVQMVNARMLPLLLTFLHCPTYETYAKLIHIPSVYHVLEYELIRNGQFSPQTIALCRWLYFRAECVRREYLVHKTIEPVPQTDTDSAKWRQTGCYYAMPQIRFRPFYPQLKEDSKDMTSDRKYGCRKYYSTYSPKKLTGGIMVCWCTHSVAYGFHSIPVGEGRNDVFSAMYTRWEKAPDIVVYDFACELQPYCMLREPEFFQNTLFAIDDFHAADHTKCASACFLKSYKNSDPRLLPINTSAGECGNQGLGRIRKAIGYMGQERAMSLTKVFLSIWNCMRIRKLFKITS